MTKKLFLIAFLAIAIPHFAFCVVTFTSVKSGLWNDPSVWSKSGSGNSTFPSGGDVAIISSGNTVTLNFNIGDVGAQNGIKGVIVNAGGILNWQTSLGSGAGFLLFAAGDEFRINGTATIRCFELKANAAVTSGVGTGGSLTTSECGTIAGTFAISGNASLTGSTISGTLTVSGSVTLTNATCTGTIAVNGSLALQGSTSFSGAGTITNPGGTGSLYNYSTISTTGTGTVFGLPPASVPSGGSTISGYIWPTTGTSNWNTGSNWIGGAVPGPSSVISIMPGGTQPVISAAGAACGKMTLNTGCTLTINSPGTLTMSDSMVVKGSANFNLNGTLTTNGAFMEGGTMTVGTGGSIIANQPVTVSGTANFIFNAGSMTAPSISISSTLPLTLYNASTVTTTGAISLTGGTINLNNTSTLTSGGALTLNGASTISLTGTSHISANGGLTLSGTSNVNVGSGTYLTTAAGTPLTMNSGTSLDIKPNAWVTAGGPTALNGSNCLFIESSASGTGSFIDNGTITGTGTAKIQKYTTSNKWHFISSPITNGLAGIYLNQYLRLYNENSNTWGDWVVPQTTPLISGKGYGLFSVTADRAYEYIGTPATGTIQPTVAFTNISLGLNLVGNPYPSALDWNAVSGWTRTGISDYIIFWNPALNAYGVYMKGAGSGTNNATNIIPLGQGFFIWANAAAPTFSVANAARVNSISPFFKSNTADQYVKFKVEGSKGTDEIMIRVAQECDENYDFKEDAPKFFGPVESPQLYMNLPGDHKVCINSIPEIKNDMRIPVASQFGVTENYYASVSGLNTFTDEVHLFLEDSKTGQSVNMSEGGYSFSATAGDSANRFQLHFVKGPIGVKEKDPGDPLVFSYGSNISVTFPDNSVLPSSMSVYDMLGRTMKTGIVLRNHVNNVVLEMAPGYYVVKIVGKSGVFSQKVFLN